MPINNTTEYHLSRWNTYHDIVKTYNQELSVRFGTIFTIITSAWVLGSASALGMTGRAPGIAGSASKIVETASEIGGTGTGGNDNLNVLLTVGVTLAPVLLTLLLLHEMRIFIQYQQDNYFMIYHAYHLCSEDSASEFEHILNVTQGSGTPVATFLFMLLSNTVVLAVPIINLIVLNFSGLQWDSRIIFIFANCVNIGCLCIYIAGVIGSVVQYFILCSQIDSQVWLFAVRNNIKLTGAKVMRTSVLPTGKTLRYLFAHTRMGLKGKGEAASSTYSSDKLNKSFTIRNLREAISRLNWGQRKALFACVYDSWYRTKEKPNHVLPYTAFIDVTTRCTLNCKGCFAEDLEKGSDIDYDKLEKVIAVLKEGGVKAIVFTGGEPTLWPFLYDVIATHRDILFLVFTNGQKQLFEHGKLIKKLGNLIFIFSIDGNETGHESRRGVGTYQSVIDNMNYFHKKKIGFATSTTVTAFNYSNIQDFLSEFEKYEPAIKFLFRFNVHGGLEELSDKDYGTLSKSIGNFSGLVVNLPQDELGAKCGGCVAGQYIFHIRQNFTLGNCPFNRETTDTTIEDLSAQGIADLLKKQTGRCHCPPRSANEREDR